MNTEIKRTKVTNFFIKNNICFVSYISRFIEFKRDVTVKRRIAEVVHLLVDRFFLVVGVA